ncbi:MAG: class I SAM-dependent methyltransferase [Acidobacteriaceae bacterium]
MPDAAELAQSHWNETPLFLTEEERYSVYPWLYQVAEFRKHRGEKVLEVGCGTGADLLQFAKHGALAIGVDLTTNHVELARNRVGNLAVVHQADARHLPFADESFDYVYSHGVLHHCDEPEQVVREIFRVLRPGGRFNVHVYALWSYITLLKFLRYGSKWKLHIENSETPVHIDLYTGRKLRGLLGPDISIEKYQCKPSQFLSPLLGWFLVAKGQKT